MLSYFFRPLQQGNEHPKMFKSEKNFFIGGYETVLLVLDKENSFKQICGPKKNNSSNYRGKKLCVIVTNMSQFPLAVKTDTSLFTMLQCTNLKIKYVHGIDLLVHY